MKNRLGAFISSLFFVFFLIPTAGRAEEEWRFEFLLGLAYNLPTPLTIRQSGEEKIDLSARYRTLAFQFPLYYAGRIGRWRGRDAWEVELIHQKLYLQNRPPEIQAFSISHGYNLLTINRAWERDRRIDRIGLGVVVAHPETTIREQSLPQDRGLFNGGDYVSGPTAQGSLQRRSDSSHRFSFPLEAKLTASYAEIPIENGKAIVPNIAAHGLIGFGYETGRSNE